MSKVTPQIKEAIDAAVRAAMAAMLAEKKPPDDAYKQTLRRLDAVKTLQARIHDNKERLIGLKEDGIQGKSKSIVRFSASGVRADPAEMYEAILADLEAHIAADTEEVETVTRALESVQKDYYYDTVYAKFMEDMTDEDIAQKLFCDDSTVRRHRGRLVHQIAIYLYGVQAL